MSYRVAVFLTVAGIIVPCVYTGARQPIRSGIDLVQLDVLVLDKHRRPVRGLSQRDFTIVEEGTVRPIIGFAAIELAVPGSVESGVAALEASRGVVTNEPGQQARLVVIVFDRTIPAGPPTVVAKTIARAAVDALGPRDLAAVVRTSGFANEGKSQNFTRDRRLLTDAVESAFTGLVSPPTMASGGLIAAGPDLLSTGDCVCGLCTLEGLERIAQALRTVRHYQKMILFIASNIVIADMGINDQCRGRIKDVRDRTLRALDRANVTVHAIDPSELEALTSGVSAVERRFGDVRRNLQTRQGNLEVLPSYTGGRVVRNTNAPGDLVPAIFAETASYYLLGFERGGGPSDRDQRPVKVRVNRADVTVVARKAYYPASPAVRSTATDPLDDTITGVLPLPDIRMALSVASAFTTSGQVTANVVIGVNDESLRAATGAAARTHNDVPVAGTDVELVLGLFDSRAKPVSAGRIRFEPRTGSCAAGWCESVSQVTLKPGRYEVRAGVFDRKSAKGGSVYGYVEVPALASDAFALSDLQIGGVGDSDRSLAPTLRRTFRPQERLAILTQVRRPLGSTAPVTLRAIVADGQTEAVVQNSSVLENSSFSASGVSEVKVDQPLSKLSPGAYLLTIEASHVDRVVRRTVSFEVR